MRKGTLPPPGMSNEEWQSRIARSEEVRAEISEIRSRHTEGDNKIAWFKDLMGDINRFFNTFLTAIFRPSEFKITAIRNNHNWALPDNETVTPEWKQEPWQKAVSPDSKTNPDVDNRIAMDLAAQKGRQDFDKAAAAPPAPTSAPPTETTAPQPQPSTAPATGNS